MPFPTNNSRPAIPYAPAQVLPNHNRYGSLGKFPPTAQQLDGDFNGIIDLLNTLAGAVNDTAAGIFPGADNPLNANKLPTTDGAGNVSWTHITSLGLTDNAVQTRHIQDTAITTPKIQLQAVETNQLADGSVTTAKIFDNAVTTAKILDNGVTTAKLVNNAVTTAKIPDNAVTTAKIPDNAITTAKIKDNAVTTAKIPDNAITTAKMPDRAVTVAKISSGSASAGDVLTANGAGKVSYLANKGRILQIVSYQDKEFIQGGEYDADVTTLIPRSFKTAPFRLQITPKKTDSQILIFYSINVGTAANEHATVIFCKNNKTFKIGKDDADSSKWGVTHSLFNPLGRSHGGGQYGCFNFSSLFIDRGVSGEKIVYEIKKARPYTTLNSGYNGGDNSISVMYAIEVDL
jgi:hypothetical protein